MDQERFDHLTRGLASGITRRGLVCNLTGAAIGGVLAVLGASEAKTRQKKRKKTRGGGTRKRQQNPYTACCDVCAGAAENTPTRTVVFSPSSEPFLCNVFVNQSGFAARASYTAEYWSAVNPGGKDVQNDGDVMLGPADMSGSSQTNLGTFFEGGYLDIRFPGGAPDFQWLVDC